MAADAETIVTDVGLSILSDSQHATIDIVFVHGLQGHPRDTWTYKSSSRRAPLSNAPKAKRSLLGPSSDRKRRKIGSSEEAERIPPDGGSEVGETVYWPKNLLAADFPTARIMTFGYDSTVTKGYQPVTQSNIFSHARDLLYALAAKRRKVHGRDLVFIAHSLGGILTKEVLRRSETDPDPKINGIFASTTGIFFFGTPHRGSKEWASFGEGIAALTGRLLGVDTNAEIVRALLPTGVELELCRESFTTQWVKRGSNLTIVPADSSTLDHPNQRARTVNDDHIGMVKFPSKSDKTYEAVKEDLEELVENSARVEPTVDVAVANNVHSSVYYLPLARNLKFVGRGDILQELERKLFVDQDCQRMAIVGLGGIGKTQVARQFAQSMRHSRSEYSIFWVPATSMESFEQAYGEIARLMQIPPPAGRHEDVKELVQRHLSMPIAGKWLLIVDNADDTKVLFTSTSSQGIVDFLPTSEEGSVLFTTRHHEVAQSLAGSDVVEMNKMSQDEASDFLYRALTQKDHIEEGPALELLEKLDYLPLAISQAAAYMNTKKTTMSRYLKLMTNTDADLVELMSYEFRDNTRYSRAANAVATTWIVSFNQILTENADAIDLLAFMSCIEWKAIPRSILPRVQPAARMDAAIGTICSYSFMTRQEDEETYNMHRLVHLALRTWLRNAGRDSEAKIKAVHHVGKVFPRGNWEERMVWRANLPHASRLDVIDLEDCVAEKQELRLRIGTCLRNDDRRQGAVAWLRKSYEWREKNLAPEDHDRLVSQYGPDAARIPCPKKKSARGPS